MKLKLNLGSGRDYREGWINLDFYNPAYRVDVIHNLEVMPFPFDDNTIDEINCSMVLEHMSNPLLFLREVIRISKNGCKIKIIVPHATTYAQFSAFDHKASFTEASFGEQILKEAGLEQMKLVSQKFIYVNKWKRFIPFKGYLKIFLNGVYDDMEFDFVVVKGDKTIKENDKTASK